MPSRKDELLPLPARLALTALAAGAAETATFPIDLVKTRLQLEGQAGSSSGGTGSKPSIARRVALQNDAANIFYNRTSKVLSHSKSVPHTLTKTYLQSDNSFTARTKQLLPLIPSFPSCRIVSSVVRAEGIKGLYAGVTPAVVRHVPYTGTRILIYEYLRDRLASSEAGSTTTAAPSLAVRMVSGLTAGAIGQAVAVPADLIKVRMQADGRAVSLGQRRERRYRGMSDAARLIVREEGGVRALWRGATPSIQRAALVNLGELATYDAAKRAVLSSGLAGDDLWGHLLSSVASGLVASLVSTPADVVKTRLMNQDPARPMYRGSIDCLLQSARKEGVVALWRGFLPTWARLGPWQCVFWVTFEELRKAAGMGGF